MPRKPDEDTTINQAITGDPDTWEMGTAPGEIPVSEDQLPLVAQEAIKAARGRPKLAPGKAKAHFSARIDTDVIKALREKAAAEGIRHTALANQILREALIDEAG